MSELYCLKQEAKQLLKCSQWTEAEEILKQIIVLSPNDIKAFIKLGSLYHYELKNEFEAENHYLSALTIDTRDISANYHLAKLYCQQRRYNDSHLLFKKCLKIDNNKAGVHYHFAVLLEKSNKVYDAYLHHQKATIIKPNIANYHYEYAKICVELYMYDKADKSFIKALQISQYQEAKHLFKYAMFKKQYYGDGKAMLYHLNLAINIDVNNIKYKYHYLRIKNDDKYCINPISERRSYSEKRNPLKNVIEKKFQLLVCGYTNTSKIMSSDIEYLCYQYLIGHYFETLSTEKLAFFTDFGKIEIVEMFFDILCPGNKSNDNNAKIIFIITKLLDLMEYGMNNNNIFFSKDYMLILRSILDIIDIHSKLSLINDTKEYLRKLVTLPMQLLNYPPKFDEYRFATYDDVKVFRFLTKLFKQNNAFYEIYKITTRAEVWSYYRMKLSVLPYSLASNEFMSLSMRKLIMPLLFPNGIKINMNEKIISALKGKLEEYSSSRSKYCLLIQWLYFEIMCLNKEDINDKIQILLNEIIGYILKNWKHYDSRGMRDLCCNVIKLCEKYHIPFKPYSMSWDDFCSIIASINDCTYTREELWDNSEINAILSCYFKHQIEVNDVDIENWKRCCKNLSFSQISTSGVWW